MDSTDQARAISRHVVSKKPRKYSEHRPFFKVLGVKVHALQIPDVILQMKEWISAGTVGHFIAVTGMHGVVEAQHEPSLKQILNSADLVVPDGMPLVWLARWRGYALKRRVYGPELMETFCRETGSRYRHFLYGGAPGVPELLAKILADQQGVRVVGTYSPPFRLLTPAESEEVAEMINGTNPDVLWVGLSTPKQERWMYERRNTLRVPVMLGVGAAFDLNTGRVRQAPRWIREHGLEWLFRLLMEPRRLWKRYLLYGSQFIAYVALEILGRRKFD
jgi:N-acetylglucosaminyldiphosphoundecaprenol N-acetyl-beta-D-mannosaminyltransferase